MLRDQSSRLLRRRWPALRKAPAKKASTANSAIHNTIQTISKWLSVALSMIS